MLLFFPSISTVTTDLSVVSTILMGTVKMVMVMVSVEGMEDMEVPAMEVMEIAAMVDMEITDMAMLVDMAMSAVTHVAMETTDTIEHNIVNINHPFKR